MTVLTSPRGACSAAAASARRCAAPRSVPRISVFRSNRGIFAQLIDDDAGRTLAASLDRARPGLPSRWSRRRAPARCWPSAPRPRASSTAVFDRGGYQYHGRVKALAEGAREGGLTF